MDTFNLFLTIDGGPYAARHEVSNILRRIADRIDGIKPNQDFADGSWSRHYQTILDSTGTDIGRYAFKPKHNGG